MSARWLAAVTIALVTAMFATLPAQAEPVAGTVLILHGDCSATTAGARRSLATGSAVNVGDIVETAADARLKLRMADGSVISVASGTHLTVASYAVDPTGKGRDVDLKLDNGLLRAVVAQATAPSSFDVDTPAGVAAVRGTDWFIRSSGDTTQVGVLTGKVNLLSKSTRHSVDIPTHWGAKLAPGLDPVQPRRWQDAEFDQVISETNVN